MSHRSALGCPLRVAVVAAASLASFSCSNRNDGSAAYPLDDELRLNQIQVLSTHNSYHRQVDPPIFALLVAFDADLARTLEYSHRPLAEQLDLGVRHVEIDGFPDPVGGLYATPAGPRLTNPNELPLAVMQPPGWKVLHVQDVDFRSTCPTMVACLSVIRDWSDAHPGHVPIFVQIEPKDDRIPDPGLDFVIPKEVDAQDLDDLDREILATIPREKIITPDDVRGPRATLEEAVTQDGWPTLGAARGKLIFGLDTGGRVKQAYIAGHPSLRGRVIFTSSPPGEPEGAFVVLNDPVGDADRIREAVNKGFLVRTRADSDTEQARTGDTTKREAALASGAQFVSTDYPEPDPRFGTDYAVAIPGGTPGRCNPLVAPADCTSLDVENPAYLVQR